MTRNHGWGRTAVDEGDVYRRTRVVRTLRLVVGVVQIDELRKIFSAGLLFEEFFQHLFEVLVTFIASEEGLDGWVVPPPGGGYVQVLEVVVDVFPMERLHFVSALLLHFGSGFKFNWLKQIKLIGYLMMNMCSKRG